MRLNRLLSALLAPSLAIAVYGCADTDTPDVEYEANRPIYEDDTAVIEDPAGTNSPTTTSPQADWDEAEQDAANQTAPATDPITQPPANPTPDASGTTSPDASGGTGVPSEDVEEEPASDLPEEAENQTETEDPQP